MTVGFQSIIDASTVIQIDQDTQCWQFKEKGTVSISSNVPYDEFGIGHYGTFTVTSSVPIVVALDGVHAIRHIYRNGTTWKFYVAGYSAATLNYYVFEPSTTLVETFGLAIYDASGNLCFQSGAKQLRIVGAGAGTYASGPTYAAIVTSFATQNTSDPYVDEETLEEGWFDYGVIKGAGVASNVVTEEPVDMYSIISIGGSSIGSWDDTHPTILVVDVTGL